MVKLYTTAFTGILFFSGYAQSQWLEGEMPYSMQAGLHVEHNNTLVLAGPDLMSVFEQDLALAEETGREYIGRVLPVNLSMTDLGTWSAMPDGSKFWTAKFQSAGALALAAIIHDLHIPCGGRLWAITGDRVYYDAPFTCSDINKYRSHITGDIYGDELILEYHQPAWVKAMPSFTVEGIDYFYRHIYDPREDMMRGSDECQVDVNCPEGAEWVNATNASVRLLIQDSQGSFLCSGVMVNTTARDCRQYMLTAEHCVEGIDPAEFADMQVRFNYERSGCATGSGPTNRNRTGTTLLADCNCGGGNNGSDFALFEITQVIDLEAWEVYFAGWDATSAAATSGVSVHHPSGDRKKISTFTQTVSSNGWGAPNTHWRVVWAPTENGHGVTEGGSSGGALFNQNKRVVGNLTGGLSFCTTPFDADLYGKFATHWSGNPNSVDQKLKPWLDPLNTNVTSMEGSYTPCDSGLTMEEEAISSAVGIFPNPAEESFTFTNPAGLDGILSLYDATGRLVLNQRITSVSARVSVKGMPSGYYSLKWTSGLKIQTRPLIVQ